MKFSEVVEELGPDWKQEIPSQDMTDKVYDRTVQIIRKSAFIHRHLTEYTNQTQYSVLDLGCGAGTFLEVMRYYGNEIMGTELGRFSFLQSQGIPYREHDCHDVPYPWADNSFDLVALLGVAGHLEDFFLSDITDEMFRIAKKAIIIKVNSSITMSRLRPHLRDSRGGWSYIELTPTVAKCEICNG